MYKILFLLILLSSLNSTAQDSTKYLYAQVDTNLQFDYNFQFGEIELQKEKRYKKHIIESGKAENNADAFIAKLSENLKSLPKNRQNILFYIHGMMGHRDSYLSLVTKTMDKDIYTRKDNKYGMVVYLIWRAGMNYGKNIKQTLKMGEEFAGLIQKVDKNISKLNANAEISILCHSMGNRVFQGIFSKYYTDGIEKPPFEDVILAAADLETDIFYKGQPLEKVGTIAEEIHVYFHEYDRTLMMSQLVNQTERLGLNGITNLDNIPENIILIDASFLDDNENIYRKRGNHHYYFTSPILRGDLLNLLHSENCEELPHRKELDHPRKFALITE